MLKSYLKKITDISNRGDAREESFYSALSQLLDDYAESTGRKNIHVTTLPKKTEAGNPDFRVWDGNIKQVGYIEAKAPTVANLDHIEDTDQLKRYTGTFPNVILTNFLEFRLYRNGDLIDRVQIARPFTLNKLKSQPAPENEGEFFALLEKFFSFSLPKLHSARSLAVELAKRTRFLKDEVVTQELKEDEADTKNFITGFYNAFKKYLIAGLTEEEFADLYSQTVTYGLFAARTRSENGFNRKLAYDKIPRTIGILREVFRFISLGDVPRQMEWIIDDISEVLAVTDVKKILHEYFHEGKGKDPIVHFYETFLAEYDPKTREKRGVYYTPEPVVSYIVRSLNIILKEKFGKPDGFASSSVTVLDPGAGTLTFLAEAAKLAVDEFVSKYGEGGRDNFIKEDILSNFYAFELMMAPYAVGHLKMSFLLEELGYKLQPDDRFKLYLTNTLEMEELEQTELPGMASLSEESHEAGKVKKDQPILVIMGNPPYSGHSANLSEKYVTMQDKKTGKEKRKKVKTWIGELIEDYKVVDGKPLGERNPKWLQDDYVKFIRFAQWKIDQAGEGVLGFITNHSYLDNPTFRGMRQSLMKSFNEIYILDLHGNSLKKEKCPDGSKDENVFDIRQGVAIALFIKRKLKEKREIHHSEIWGLRDEKYNWLEKKNINTTKWKKLSPKSAFYLFIPRDEKLLKDYDKFIRVPEIFPTSNVGIVTSRDKFVIDTDKEALKRRIRMFIDKKIPDEIIEQTYSLKDKSNWNLHDARAIARKDADWENLITQIAYRPFDSQWIFYNDALIERSRKEVMSSMLEKNLGLITRRQMLPTHPCNYFFVSQCIICDGVIRSDNKGSESIFPLYLYPDTEKKDLFNHKQQDGERKPNFSQEFYQTVSGVYGKGLSPEEIFYYIYGVLYSNTYRTKYSEFLKIDFPKVPFTKSYELLGKMAELGEKLVNLHLLKSPELDSPIAKFQGDGDEKVDKPNYKEGSVYINKTQYFEGIEPDVWEYQIGGYQVCHKWLKDRKGRKLSLEDIKHYCKVVTALKKTIEIQELIDDIYEEIEKDIIEFQDK